jgi:transcriptional regulator with XRE-family HTH domain
VPRPRKLDYVEVRRLREEQGLTLAEIGKRFNVTSQAVGYALSAKRDVADGTQPDQHREAYVIAEKKKGRSFADIARELGVTRQRVEAITKRARRQSGAKMRAPE